MIKIVHSKLWITLVLFVCYVCHITAQNSLAVDIPNAIFVNQSFTVSFEYTGHNQPTRFIAPHFNGLKVLYGPAQSYSSSTSIVNGKLSSSSSSTYTYTLIADKEGSYHIGSASIIVNNKKISSKPTAIKVLPSTTTTGAPNNGLSPIAFTPVVSKKTVYLYEPIFMNLKIYNFNASNINFDKYPIFDGFLNERLTDSTNNMATLGVDKYNGRNYKSLTFGNCILIPQKTGKLKVGPVTIQLTFQEPDDDPDDFFNMGSTPVTQNITSNTVYIDVKPLPEEGKPANFSGLVGSFSSQLLLQPGDYKTGQAITFKLIIQGNGNLKSMNIIRPVFPDSFDTYDPSSTYTQKVTRNGIICNKEIDYLVVPRKVGRFTIAPISINYFDPNVGVYKTIKTQPITINIGKGTNANTKTLVSSGDDNLQFNPTLTTIDENISDSISFVRYYWIFYILVILIAFVVYKLISKNMALRSDVVAFRASKANTVARKRLKMAERYATEVKTGLFYEEIMKALWQYVGHKLRIPVSDLNMENTLSLLHQKGVSLEICQEFKYLIEVSEQAHYSPLQSYDDLYGVYQRSIAFITNIENLKIK